MPSGKISNMQDGEDLIRGCLILGTGGGGWPERGLQQIREALADGYELAWVDAEDIPDDALTVQPYAMGSVAPISEETNREIQRAGLQETTGMRSMEEAVKELGRYLGKPVGCIVAAEPGVSNLPDPLAVGARLGIPVVDGDYAGRCIPEEMQTTCFLAGKPGYPFVSVDRWGDVVICKHAQGGHMVERIGKMLGVAAYQCTYIAATPLIGKKMKEIVVRGTITRCMKIGGAIRTARKAGRDPIEAVVRVVNGWRLFEGVVAKKEWEDRGGYMFGTIILSGTGTYRDHTLKVWFKNENHVSWLDGKPFVCSPDLVTLAYEDGRGTTSTDIREGEKVVAIGIRGVEAFRTPFGLDHASGPRYFGFDIDYMPIEERMKQD